jgi:YD repeat-containing protein
MPAAAARASLTTSDSTGAPSCAYWPNGTIQSVKNGDGRRVSYAYDGAGNLTSLTYPNPADKVIRTYDALNRLSTVKDWLGHTTTFSYDNNSNLANVAYPTTNNLGAAYSYDTANGLKTIVDATNATTTPLPFWTYNYTLDGNQAVKTATDPVNGTAAHTFTRNLLSQLTQDSQSGGSGATNKGWGYDSA